MLSFASPVVLQLQPGQLIRCVHAGATQLRVVQGRVWVTRANDLGDHFLEPGQAIHLAPGARALVSAEGTAQVLVEAGRGRAEPALPPAYAAGAP